MMTSDREFATRGFFCQIKALWDATLTESEIRNIAEKLRRVGRVANCGLAVAVALAMAYFALEVVWAFRPGGPVDQIRSVR